MNSLRCLCTVVPSPDSSSRVVLNPAASAQDGLSGWALHSAGEAELLRDLSQFWRQHTTVTPCSTKPPFPSPARPGLAELSLHLQLGLNCRGRAACGSRTRPARMLKDKGTQWKWNGQRRQQQKGTAADLGKLHPEDAALRWHRGQQTGPEN